MAGTPSTTSVSTAPLVSLTAESSEAMALTIPAVESTVMAEF
jgi:hypothetical protein